ncbi:hypothetical protein NUU61_004061 [Penicillium alfredii]|uniref:Uncharacterized protein n=1 Tax=Penicillium alfredii TaxID=1506179 RepID=A0A9W9FKK7_9EURO|nr:uncharacterized protein NUU61_004061 [Penicillium alfredii]KAJ5101839.1 hypothetical protein NUU61_004061 [Penicillium alfredii]
MRAQWSDLMGLFCAARDAGVLVFGVNQLMAIHDANGVAVTFADGPTNAADLLLGCHGIYSCVWCEHIDPAQMLESLLK